MKKRRLLSLVMMLVLVSIMAIGCKDSSKSEDETTTAAAEKNDIVGAWSMNLADALTDFEDSENTEDSEMYIDISFTYTFNEDGTGSISALGETIDFTYEIDDDQLSISMTYEGETETESGKFKVDGDTLTLYSSDGESVDTVLERVK